MYNKKFVRAVLIALCLVGIAGIVYAASTAIPWRVSSGGGHEATSSSYTMQATLGQLVTSSSSSASYTLNAGYWVRIEGDYIIFVPLVLLDS